MDNSALLPWVVSHLKYLTIPMLITLVGIFYKLFVFILKIGRVAVIVEQRVLKAEQTIHLMATNHLPHIQTAVEESNKHLSSMNELLRMVLVRRSTDA